MKDNNKFKEVILPEISKKIYISFEKAMEYLRQNNENTLKEINNLRLNDSISKKEVIERMHEIYLGNSKSMSRIRAFSQITQTILNSYKTDKENKEKFTKNKEAIFENISKLGERFKDYQLEIREKIAEAFKACDIKSDDISKCVSDTQKALTEIKKDNFKNLNDEYFKLKNKNIIYNYLISFNDNYNGKAEDKTEQKSSTSKHKKENSSEAKKDLKDKYDNYKEQYMNLYNFNLKINEKAESFKSKHLENHRLKKGFKSPEEEYVMSQHYRKKAYEKLVDSELNEKVLKIINLHKARFNLYGEEELKGELEKLGGDYLYRKDDDNIFVNFEDLAKEIENLAYAFRINDAKKIYSKYDFDETFEDFEKNYYISVYHMRAANNMLDRIIGKTNKKSNELGSNELDDSELFSGLKKMDYDYIKNELESLSIYKHLKSSRNISMFEDLFTSGRIFVNLNSSKGSAHYPIGDGYIILSNEDKRGVIHELGHYLEYSMVKDHIIEFPKRHLAEFYAQTFEIDYIKSYINDKDNNSKDRKVHIMRYITFMYDRICRDVRAIKINNSIVDLINQEKDSGKSISNEDVQSLVNSFTYKEKYELIRYGFGRSPYDLLKYIISWYMSVNMQILMKNDESEVTLNKYLGSMKLNVFKGMEDIMPYLGLDIFGESMRDRYLNELKKYLDMLGK